jgi:hypothetical protein
VGNTLTSRSIGPLDLVDAATADAGRPDGVDPALPVVVVAAPAPLGPALVWTRAVAAFPAAVALAGTELPPPP